MKDLLLCVLVVAKTFNLKVSFSRIRQRIVLKCVPHVQHDYFLSSNQSDLCSLASSLPLPSPLLKLPTDPGPLTRSAEPPQRTTKKNDQRNRKITIEIETQKHRYQDYTKFLHRRHSLSRFGNEKSSVNTDI